MHLNDFSSNVHIIFVGNKMSPKGHWNIYSMFVLSSKSSVEGEKLLEIIMLEVLNLL